MKDIKISNDQLILKQDYNEGSVILTANFSSSFEKKFLQSFKKYIQNKIKLAVFNNDQNTSSQGKYFRKITKIKADIRNFNKGSREFKKMLSNLYNNLVKIRQRDDLEYEKQFLRELKLIFRDFFRNHRKIKEVINYHDSVDLIEMITRKKVYYEKLEEAEGNMKRELNVLKKSKPNNVIDTNSYRPFTYHNFPITLLGNSGLKIEISKFNPYKDSDVNAEKYFKMMIEFKAIEVYSNFFKLLKINLLKMIKTIDPSSFDSEHFLLLNCKKEQFKAKIRPFKKHVHNFIEYKQTKSNLGLKLKFDVLFKGIWGNFISKSLGEKSLDKTKTSKKKKRKKRISNKKLILSTISASIVIVVIISALMLYSPKAIHIEPYDKVKLHYTVWKSNECKTYEFYKPILNSTIWVNVTAINDTNLENPKFGLILGLYNNLLEKELYQESDFIWLNRCIDQNYDGYDDFTNQPALTFGHYSNQYFNICLIIHFKILSIQKNKD